MKKFILPALLVLTACGSQPATAPVTSTTSVSASAIETKSDKQQQTTRSTYSEIRPARMGVVDHNVIPKR